MAAILKFKMADMKSLFPYISASTLPKIFIFVANYMFSRPENSFMVFKFILYELKMNIGPKHQLLCMKMTFLKINFKCTVIPMYNSH